jgi:hypothetical protein
MADHLSPQLREHADALALAIEHGLAEVREASDWASEIVADDACPSGALLELAGAVRPNAPDVVRMLRTIAGACDAMAVFRKFLARLRDAVRARPEAWPQITRLLEQLAILDQVPTALAGRCYSFDDARNLADQGVYGSVEAVEAELRAFLETESEPSSLIP